MRLKAKYELASQGYARQTYRVLEFPEYFGCNLIILESHYYTRAILANYHHLAVDTYVSNLYITRTPGGFGLFAEI
jgi:hypothetical protein